MLTPDILVKAGLADQHAAEAVTPSLVLTCQHFGIDTPKRIAAFLAQCAVESMRFTKTRESLNYSVGAIMSVASKSKRWRALFPSLEVAKEYAHQSEKLANYVYAGLIGNGPKESGDGWRFRGRGLIQITGRANYLACGRALGVDLIANPDLAAEFPAAAESAGWFWDSRKLNVNADDGQIDVISKAVNGGTLGLLERREFHQKTLAVLTEEA